MRGRMLLAVLAAVVLGVPAGAALAQTAGGPVKPVVICTKENVPRTPKLEELPLQENVTQYGITWTFEKPARVGQFINGEDDQTGLCPFEYKGKTYEKCWTGAKAFFVGHSREEAGGGSLTDGWGPVELFHPSQWPKAKLSPSRVPASEAYRRANTSAAWVASALSARILHAEKTWNHDAFFAYVDRWMTEDDTPFNEEIKKAGGPDYNREGPRRFSRHLRKRGSRADHGSR